MIKLICGIEKKGTNELTYKTEVESQMQETNLWLPGDRHIHTTRYKIDN